MKTLEQLKSTANLLIARVGADNHGKECAHYDCFFNTGEIGCSLHFDLTCRVSTVYEPEDNDDDEIIDKLSEMYGGEKS